ncbi:Hypothetical_protein [Hexamita inflata]|nr:Hypothetical protein HINF_LOCUS45939 [Hexamita inflata]
MTVLESYELVSKAQVKFCYFKLLTYTILYFQTWLWFMLLKQLSKLQYLFLKHLYELYQTRLLQYSSRPWTTITTLLPLIDQLIKALLVQNRPKNYIKVDFQQLVEALVQAQVIYRSLQQQQLLGLYTRLCSNFLFTSIFVNLGNKNLIFELYNQGNSKGDDKKIQSLKEKIAKLQRELQSQLDTAATVMRKFKETKKKHDDKKITQKTNNAEAQGRSEAEREKAPSLKVTRSKPLKSPNRAQSLLKRKLQNKQRGYLSNHSQKMVKMNKKRQLTQNRKPSLYQRKPKRTPN